MDNRKHLNDLHTENSDWISEFNLLKDQIASFRQRLSEVASANNKNEVLAHVEHFQNQFIVQRNTLDELKHQVKAEENELASMAAQTPEVSHRIRLSDHEELREKVISFEKVFNDLKTEFEQFLSKTL